MFYRPDALIIIISLYTVLSNSRYEILTIHTSKTLYNILMRLLIIEDEPKIARIIAERPYGVSITPWT